MLKNRVRSYCMVELHIHWTSRPGSHQLYSYSAVNFWLPCRLQYAYSVQFA